MKKEKKLQVPVVTVTEISEEDLRDKLLKNWMPNKPPKFNINEIVILKDGLINRAGIVTGIRISASRNWYYDISTFRLCDGVIERISASEGRLEKTN